MCAIAALTIAAVSANAQTAKVRIVHNAADPGARLVDVYAAGQKIADNFPFRHATRWLTVPANLTIPISINQPTSTDVSDKVIKTFSTPSLQNGKSYIVVANGVGIVADFDATVNTDIALDLFPIADVDSLSRTKGLHDIYAYHGITDAPAVNLYAEGVPQALIRGLKYGESKKISVPPGATYTLKLTAAADTVNAVRTYKLPVEADDTTSVFVFASGFLNPGKNKSGASGELFFTPLYDDKDNTATFVRAERLPSTMYNGKDGYVQIIHNCPEPAADKVDLYVNGTRIGQSFAYRKATGFLPLPAGVLYSVSVNLPGSANEFDKEVAKFELELEPEKSYYGIASGTLDKEGFTPVAGRNIDFTIIGAPAQKASTNADKIQAAVFHGSPDAPAVDVFVNGAKVDAISNLDYAGRTPYADLNPGTYVLGVAPKGGTPIANFGLTLPEGAKGAAGLVVASGFLAPTGAKANRTFGLLLVLPTGDVAELGAAPTSVEETIIEAGSNAIMPNPAADVAQLRYTLNAQSAVRISIVDALGNEVLQTNEGILNAGVHTTPLALGTLTTGTYTARILSNGAAVPVRFAVVR